MMGLGAYSVHILWCNATGLGATNAPSGTNTASNTMNMGMGSYTSTDGTNEILAKVADTAANNSRASFITNACWTAIQPFMDATHAGYRLLDIGFSGSGSSCMDHAVDGYTVWGYPVIYRIKVDHTVTIIKKDVAKEDALMQTKVKTVLPFSGDGGIGDLGGTQLGFNTGQVRAAVPILKDAAEVTCLIFTSNEYYSDSAIVCVTGVIATDL